MKKRAFLSLGLLMSLCSCSSQLAYLHKDKYDNSAALDEMRIELSDMKYALNNAQVEIEILEEKLRQQESSLQYNKQHPSTLALDLKISSLEQKISHIESLQNKICAEYKHLFSQSKDNSHAFNQYHAKLKLLESDLLDHQKLLQDLSDLKPTIRAISEALKIKNSSVAIHKVKAGDTLEKIAKAYQSSVDAIQKENQLSSSKIVLGQDLKVPHGSK